MKDPRHRNCRIFFWLVMLAIAAGIVALGPDAFSATAEVVGLAPSSR